MIADQFGVPELFADSPRNHDGSDSPWLRYSNLQRQRNGSGNAAFLSHSRVRVASSLTIQLLLGGDTSCHVTGAFERRTGSVLAPNPRQAGWCFARNSSSADAGQCGITHSRLEKKLRNLEKRSNERAESENMTPASMGIEALIVAD